MWERSDNLDFPEKQIDSFAKNLMSTGTPQTTGSTGSLYYR
jgi:hypothetical protein